MDTKRGLLLIAIFLFALKSSFSQVNIELNDFFRPWYNYNYLIVDDTLTSPQIGANCNWNFNGLSSTNELNVDIQPIDWFDDSAKWVSNSYVINEANQNRTIVNFTDSNFSCQAITVGSRLYRFVSPEIQFSLPFNYGETFNTLSKAIFKRDTSIIIGLIDSARNVLTRNRTCESIGFGNIQIYNQTYSGMLVKETIYSFDTLEYRNSLLGWISSFTSPKIDTTITYIWYAKIVGAVAATLKLGSNNFREFRVLKNSPVISGIKEFSEHVNLYPNPFVSELRILSDVSNFDIVVYDILGKIMYQQKIESNQASINLSKLETGTYMVEIITKNQTTIKKINKQ